ncbi:hypothetical protein NRB56_20100 [Nocardia sp. RB56]|uniref:Uncharacterized protein n=1 Tax=Nocardia aurantia TaxID=2585199 RepID=A0A7K0DKY9_9NOCA|nr:hypothetical protein [Nocardia aurantia]
MFIEFCTGLLGDEERFTPAPADHSFTDPFPAADLDPRWVAPGRNPRNDVTGDGPGRLVLDAAPDESRWLLTFARDPYRTVTARLTLDRGTARLLLRMDADHWYRLTISPEAVEATIVIGPIRQAIARIERARPHRTGRRRGRRSRAHCRRTARPLRVHRGRRAASPVG